MNGKDLLPKSSLTTHTLLCILPVEPLVTDGNACHPEASPRGS